MSAHEWRSLAVFGLFAAGLALMDGRAARLVIGAAAIVVVVRNADKLPGFAGGKEG